MVGVRSSIKPIDSKKTGDKIFLFLFGMVFCLVGAGIFYFLTIRTLMQWYDAREWVPAPCRILHSSVDSHSSSRGGATYSVNIHYTYTYQEKTFTGNRYNFFGVSSSGYKGKRAIVDRYPVGSTATCFVNPENPAEAVISRDFSLQYLTGCFGLIFMGVGAGIARSAFSKKTMGNATAGGTSRLPSYSPGVELKTKTARFSRFAAVFIFSLIWNTVLLIFLFQEDQPLFMKMFLSIFMLIGLISFGVAIYFFLAIFTPQVKLTLKPASIPLGSSAVLQWRIEGNPRRIRQLKITVKGQEEVRYQQGKNMRTERSLFARIPVLETTEQIAKGEVAFALPEFSMHSFEADHNKIIWFVHVEGEIPRWPDINEQYPLTVLPLPRENA